MLKQGDHWRCSVGTRYAHSVEFRGSIPGSVFMASYRIVQRGSCALPGRAIFEVQKKAWFWWDHAGLCMSLGEAEQHILQLRMADISPIKTMVIKEYNQ